MKLRFAISSFLVSFLVFTFITGGFVPKAFAINTLQTSKGFTYDNLSSVNWKQKKDPLDIGTLEEYEKEARRAHDVRKAISLAIYYQKTTDLLNSSIYWFCEAKNIYGINRSTI